MKNIAKFLSVMLILSFSTISMAEDLGSVILKGITGPSTTNTNPQAGSSASEQNNDKQNNMLLIALN